MGSHAHGSQCLRGSTFATVSIVVWTMVGIAVWHFAVLVPDRFWGGIIGALLAAVIGAVLVGYALPTPGVPSANPPGILQGMLAVPGALAGLGLSYWYGARREAGGGQLTSRES